MGSASAVDLQNVDDPHVCVCWDVKRRLLGDNGRVVGLRFSRCALRVATAGVSWVPVPCASHAGMFVGYDDATIDDVNTYIFLFDKILFIGQWARFLRFGSSPIC